jgi:gluconolactonase
MQPQESHVMPVPPSVITNPPRQWDRSAPPTIYPDPDVVVVDPAFNDLLVDLTAIRRVWTGSRWAEGPAWSGQGQYLVFSDVQTNTQYRYLWETGEVSAFRKPSHNSNGNSFDFQGRQLSTQDFFRRVVRWEHDGSMTVIADSFEGQPLNSPNDLAPHPDGSIWFTDPPYGDRLSEGHPDFAGGPTNPDGRLNPLIGQPDAGAMGGKRRVLPTNTYRWDPSGRLELVLTEKQVPDPNGLCFSPDYKALYVVSTGKGPGDKVGGANVIYAFDVEGGKLTNQRLFSDMIVDGVTCGPDGLRADVYGNLWSGSNAPLGYAGVTVWNPQGKLLGRIRLPEVCANVAFGGPKRDHLFMTASQSLYVLQVQTQGAAPG